MQSRVIRLPLRNPIEDLSEERLIATLWGCMGRRKGTVLNQAPAIRYNQASIKLVDYVIKRSSDWFPGKYEKASEKSVERFESVIRRANFRAFQ